MSTSYTKHFDVIVDKKPHYPRFFVNHDIHSKIKLTALKFDDHNIMSTQQSLNTYLFSSPSFTKCFPLFLSIHKVIISSSLVHKSQSNYFLSFNSQSLSIHKVIISSLLFTKYIFPLPSVTKYLFPQPFVHKIISSFTVIYKVFIFFTTVHKVFPSFLYQFTK